MNKPYEVSVAIMTHPSRLAEARSLAARNELRILGMTHIAEDPAPRGTPSTLRTAQLAWSAVSASATHHLVLQDDVELAPAFARSVMTAIHDNPSNALALFVNWASKTGQCLRIAATVAVGWATVIDEFIPTQAVVMPAQAALDFARYCDTLDPSVPDNIALSRFLNGQGLEALACVPCLVEHRSIESLLGHEVMWGERKALSFISEGEGISPSAKHIRTPYVPIFEALSGHCQILFLDPERGAPFMAPAHEVMRDIGMAGTDLTKLYFSDLDTAPSAIPERSHLGHPLLFQIWLSSFVLGIAIQGAAGPSIGATGSKRVNSPLASSAISTILPGILRRFLPAPELTRAKSELLPLVMSAVNSGTLRNDLHISLSEFRQLR